MSMPFDDTTKQFIIDHWAALQPKDIGANWNVSAVAFEGSDALVTCLAPVPPNPRIVRVPLACIEAWALQMGALQPEPEPDAVKDVTFDYTPPAVEEDTDTGE